MNRNTEIKLNGVDLIECPRSKWNREFNHKLTFNAGQLIPFALDMDIIPGTTIKNKTSIVCRMTTPLCPVMDNLYLDTYYFKGSKYWYWEHWREMMGDNRWGQWVQNIDYVEPQIKLTGTDTLTNHDFAHYLGVRMGTTNLTWSKLPINFYCSIWNEFFRDQNLMAPIIYDTTDSDLNFSSSDPKTGAGFLPVCRFHDYFSSLTLQPQKATNAITMPLGTTAPVVGSKTLGLTDGTNQAGLGSNSSGQLAQYNIAGKDIGYSIPSGERTSPLNSFTGLGVSTDATKSGLIAQLSSAVAASVNAMRLAVATQRILERDNNGTRYREILRNHFHSIPNDMEIEVPRYLGGKRTPLNITTVLANSTTTNEELGATGAMSVTIDVNEDFTENFSKDEMLMGVLCVRSDRTYSQGTSRQLKRAGRLDRYWPELSHIGNMPCYIYEIFSTGTSTDNDVFGYKEAWQEYIQKNNRISGMLNVDYAQAIDQWHFGDDYATAPVFSSSWMTGNQEDIIDRALSVNHNTTDQFWADILIEQTVVAPIPLNRMPGLVDHF